MGASRALRGVRQVRVGWKMEDGPRVVRWSKAESGGRGPEFAEVEVEF